MTVLVLKKSVVNAIKDNFMPYTTYVIRERALPEIDGFKPSQRRILYTMYKMGLLKGARKKSQGVVGSTMFIHPHGDMAIYETLVRMSRDAEALLVPYIDSKGNFGKQYSKDMQFASARYTEVRLAEIAKELFIDINKNTIDMVDSFDGQMKEPKMLPVSFPNILTNVQSGTAVGMASSIASFNLREIIDFTVAYINNQKTDVQDYIKAPDFSTGGTIVYDEKKFKEIYETGKGTFAIRAAYEIKDDSIIFYEMPYTTTFEVIIDKIATLVREEKLKDVVDVNSIYGIKSKGIKVTVKKDVNKEALVEKLFKMTPLQSTFSCNFNIILNGRPKVMGVKEIIHEWVGFRAKSIKRSILHDIDKKTNKRHVLLALKEVLLDVDKAIEIIRNTATNTAVVKNLIEAFNIDEVQAEYVAEIKLRHLNKEYLINRVEEISTLESEIKELIARHENKRQIADIIIGQLEAVKAEHGQDRKSGIISIDDIVPVKDSAEEIDDFNVKVFVTEEGYIKKIPLTSLKNKDSKNKVKDGDVIIKEFDATNNSDVLVFTDAHNVYKYKLHELDSKKPSELGNYLPSLLGLKDEEIIFTTVTSDYSGNLLIGFEDGKVAKISLTAYATKNNVKKLKKGYAAKKALFMTVLHDDIDLLAVSSIDKAIVINTSFINPKASRDTQGVQFMRSKNDSKVIAYWLAQEQGIDIDYYRVSSAGVGKYLKEDKFIGLIG